MNRICVAILLMLVVIWTTGCGAGMNDDNDEEENIGNQIPVVDVQIPDEPNDSEDNGGAENNGGMEPSDDPIEEEALAMYGDILAERAQWRMDDHNINLVQEGFPTFTGFEIAELRLVDSFSHDGVGYLVYRWDAGFFTNDPNPGQYGWPQDAYADEQGRIRDYDWCCYFVTQWISDDHPTYDFFEFGLYNWSRFDAHAQIVMHFTGEVLPVPDFSIDQADRLDDAVIEYAMEHVQKQIAFYNECGAEDGYSIIEARITGIEYIPTPAVGLTDGIFLYRLTYRLLADHPKNIMMTGGMTMEGEWITEWGSTGQPYLLLWHDWSGEETVWKSICVTNTDIIMTDYGTKEMLERYGDPYLAASVELYHKYLQENTAELFSLLGHTDGAGSEDLSYELYQAFQAAPRGFIEAAAELSGDDLTEMAKLLVYYAGYFDLVDFRNQVVSCGDDMLTDSEQRVIEEILQRVDGKLDGSK